MADYKKEAALHAAGLIKEGMVVGIGAGSTMAHLVEAVAQEKDVTFVTPSAGTQALLEKYGLKVTASEVLDHLDLYFDGCDQVDEALNALKSGGGIHTYEKILANMADRFIIVGDEAKLVPKLDTQYPLAVEVIPAALAGVVSHLRTTFDTGSMEIRSARSLAGNYLLDVRFNVMPVLSSLNEVKLFPGVVDHSLFLQLAKGAIIAGPDGVKIL
jgi:ribose 5-phosphate isomerase A